MITTVAATITTTAIGSAMTKRQNINVFSGQSGYSCGSVGFDGSFVSEGGGFDGSSVSEGGGFDGSAGS